MIRHLLDAVTPDSTTPVGQRGVTTLVCVRTVSDTFQRQFFWFDFLCPEAEAGEFGQEFGWRSEVESGHAQADCGRDVFSQVVDV